MIQDMKVHLLSNFCKDFLSLFRSVILVSEQKESQVYKLHDRVVITLRSFLWMFHEAWSHSHISLKRLTLPWETSPLIFSANQWTGFYMITASVMKELKTINIVNNIRAYIFCRKWKYVYNFNHRYDWPGQEFLQKIEFGLHTSSQIQLKEICFG